MEIPDVIVVNKADHPLTDTMVREIRGVLSLANLDRSARGAARRWRVPIVKTEADRGEGIGRARESLEEHRAHILAAGELEERRRRNLRSEVLAIATARMRRRLEEELREDARVPAAARARWCAAPGSSQRGGRAARAGLAAVGARQLHQQAHAVAGGALAAA